MIYHKRKDMPKKEMIYHKRNDIPKKKNNDMPKKKWYTIKEATRKETIT